MDFKCKAAFLLHVINTKSPDMFVKADDFYRENRTQ